MTAGFLLNDFPLWHLDDFPDAVFVGTNAGPDFVKEKILLYNLLILRITGILKIMLVIDNPYGSR